MRNEPTASAHKQMAARAEALRIFNSGPLEARLERLTRALTETDRKMEQARRMDKARLPELRVQWDAFNSRWEELARKT